MAVDSKARHKLPEPQSESSLHELHSVVVVLDPVVPVLEFGPLGIIALGAFAGMVPAVKAYRTDVATNLTPAS